MLVDSPCLKALCGTMKAAPADVLKVADQLDINAALVDEILNRWAGAYPTQRAAGEAAQET
jgi:hypothetical protein